MMERLLVATKNAGKVREFREMLSDRAAHVLDLSAYPQVPTAVEIGLTFRENAARKATHYAEWVRDQTGEAIWSLADDSGLEVDALRGEPGVYSARYAGEDATDAQNMERLLRALNGITERQARFVCELTLAGPDGLVAVQVRGVCEGAISESPRGHGGFGYDPVFVPAGHSYTFAERPELKSKLSHRSAALRKLVRNLSRSGQP